MKIQLDAHALGEVIERCGGDTFVLELRHSVMEAAIRPRVKALMNDTLQKAVDEQIANEIEAQLGTLTVSRYGGTTAKLLPKYEAEVKAVAQSEADRYRESLRINVIEAVDERLAKLKEEIDALLTKRVNNQIDKLVNERVASRIAEVTQALQK